MTTIKQKTRNKETVRVTAKEIVESRPNEDENLLDEFTAGDGSETLEVELSDLYAPNGKYTPEKKVEAVMSYMLTGNSKKAAKLCGIPNGTIRWWKTQAVWWDDVMKSCRKRYGEQLDATYTNFLHTAGKKMLDRLENGNTHYDAKQDKFTQVPVSLKEISQAAKIVFQDRQLMRGEVTSRSESKTATENLDQMKKQFQNMFESVQAKTIEGEVIRKEDQNADG